MVSDDDKTILSLYLKHHRSVKYLEVLVRKLCELPCFYDDYCPIILSELVKFDLRTYLPVLAEISIHSESKDILNPPPIFSQAPPDYKASVVQFLTSSWSDQTPLTFQSLKIIQRFKEVDTPSLSALLNLYQQLEDKQLSLIHI